MPQQMQGSETPIDTVKSKMLSQPVGVLVLPSIEGLDVLDMLVYVEPEFRRK